MSALGAILLLAQGAALPPGYVLDPAPNPYDKYRPIEKLGPGPHTLVISDGNAMTRIDYKSGPACQHARNKVRLQTDPRLTNTSPSIIHGASYVTAFCVPR